jgi:hypothetical protein
MWCAASTTRERCHEHRAPSEMLLTADAPTAVGALQPSRARQGVTGAGRHPGPFAAMSRTRRLTRRSSALAFGPRVDDGDRSVREAVAQVADQPSSREADCDAENQCNRRPYTRSQCSRTLEVKIKSANTASSARPRMVIGGRPPESMGGLNDLSDGAPRCGTPGTRISG